MSLDKVPKGPTKNMADIKPPKRAEPFTLKRLLTSDETKMFYISFLKEMANKKGPWREYLDFYKANMSGDIETMSPETRKYIEKMDREIKEKYEEVMD